MNTIKTLIIAAIAASGITSASFAANEGNGPWIESGRNSIKNENNPALRFGNDGRIAIPGNGAGNANQNSAVSGYTVGGSGGIVDPAGR